MSSRGKLPVIELLYAALNSDLGVIVETSNPQLLRQKLYQVRGDDPALLVLSIVASRTNPENHLWIVRGPDGKREPTETYSSSEER